MTTQNKRGNPEIPLIEVLTAHFGADATLRGVEVGVSEGLTSAALLAAFPKLTLWMVDAWTTYPPGHAYRESGDGHAKLTPLQQGANKTRARLNTRFADWRRHIVQLDSHIAARLLPGPWDFAFIDDDHTLEGVRKSAGAWLPRIKPGGLLCGDDAGHPRDERGVWGVTQAVKELTDKLGVTFAVTGRVWHFVVPALQVCELCGTPFVSALDICGDPLNECGDCGRMCCNDCIELTDAPYCIECQKA